MIKKKRNFILRIIFWVIAHPWLKLIAFVLAVIVWFYARGEMGKLN